MKPFIYKHKWEEINFPSKKDDWKKFEKIIEQLLLMFCMVKKKKIHPPYVSKHNSDHEKQVILLMILNREGWRYLAVKKLSMLVREITLKHHGEFYYLNCLHSLTTENKRGSHKQVCENKDFLNIAMPSEDTNILESNQ